MQNSLMKSAVVALLPLVPRPLVWQISQRYIAGTSLQDALRVVAELNQGKITGTLDVLGEDVLRTEEVDSSRALYVEALDEIQRQGLDCGISVKLSDIGLRFDEGLCRRVISGLVDEAEQRGNFVRIDMEDSSVTEVTLSIYRELRQSHTGVGAVIQCYLRRSEQDVENLLDDGIANVRLCKGIYREPPELAFQDPKKVNDSFCRLLERLLTGEERVAIATHDPELIEFAEQLIQREKIPPQRYEFQMLLGVAERLRGRLVAAGHPLRVYVPFGESWFAYSRRRLEENPEIAGHVISNLFHRR